MPELSYAQNMEDYHLWLALGGRADGFYIDIGAGHPVADNVSFWFYERGWRGVAVEPQTWLVDLYQALRPRDLALCTLVGRTSGVTDFFEVDQLHGLSTTIEQVARNAARFGTAYRARRVPVITLAELCDRNVDRPIDFLKIDVEGAEADVLLGGDWRRFRPKVIVVEATLPGSGEAAWSGWEPFLLQKGYRFALFDTLNRFYVAEEQDEVAARFPRERAPWDAVRHIYEIGRAPENPAHPDNALARELARGFWASLPQFDRRMLARLLARGRGLPDDKAEALIATLDTDAFRGALGRIACGYDGGQIVKDEAS
jgi:FkbM family methyltransferase